VSKAFRLLKAEAADEPPCRTRRSNKEKNMERDVVCGMQVDPAKAAATSEYNGKTYYFCAKVCKTKFDANPSAYVKA
jgi:Cu+-exporting ATPase